MNDRTDLPSEDLEPGRDEEGFRDEPRREPVFNLPGVVVALIAICTGLHLLRWFVLSPEQDFGLILRFAFIPWRYTGGFLLDAYAFVAPISYSLLHGSVAHLVVNMIWLAAFGSPLANRIGGGRFVLFWVVTSLAAVGLHFVLHSADQSPLVGASGAISGMMGAAARFGFRIERAAGPRGRASFGGPILSVPRVLRTRASVTFLAVWMAVNFLMAFGFGDPSGEARIAWEAHIGGFLAGFLLIGLFDPRRAPVAARPDTT